MHVGRHIRETSRSTEITVQNVTLRFSRALPDRSCRKNSDLVCGGQVDLVRIREILITCLTLNGNSVRTKSLGRPGSKGEIIQRVLEE